MKLYVNATVFEPKLKWSSINYIYKSKRFNVDCKVEDKDLGICIDKYQLELEGKEKNIKYFLLYLRQNGFKIKEF